MYWSNQLLYWKLYIIFQQPNQIARVAHMHTPEYHKRKILLWEYFCYIGGHHCTAKYSPRNTQHMLLMYNFQSVCRDDLPARRYLSSTVSIDRPSQKRTSRCKRQRLSHAVVSSFASATQPFFFTLTTQSCLLLWSAHLHVLNYFW